MDNIFEYLNVNNLEDLKNLKKKYGAMDNDKIYHYTNLDSLKKMLESNSLWATNCEYLNDLLELETFEKELDQILNTDNESMILYIKNILNELSKLRKLTYIISFTNNNDSIAMWRNYGNNGIVIEFDTKAIVNTVKKNNINVIRRDNKNIKISTKNMYGYAIYDNLLIRDLLNFHFKIAKNEYKAASDEKKEIVSFQHQLETTMAIYSVYLFKKDKNFEFEDEYRIVITINEENVGKIEKFKIKNNMFIPYIDVKFIKNKILPIKSVTINPGQKDPMYENGLRHLLHAYNYDIPVYYSKSKIR